MEHLLKRAVLILALTASACRNEANLQRQEKRALERSVSEAREQVHRLDTKELNGAALTEEEKAVRQKLKEQADEDQNGGDTPEPPAAP